MNHDMRKKGLVVSVIAVSLLVGAIAGFFGAHRMMGDMSGMTTGKGGVSALPGRAGEMGDMKQMDTNESPMKGMQGMGEERVPTRSRREGAMEGM
ncbi:MAG: hypothetical protein ACT4OO_08280, partial [Nitrospiraceae bacterium]